LVGPADTGDAQPRVVIDDVEDLDVGSVGEVPLNESDDPAPGDPVVASDRALERPSKTTAATTSSAIPIAHPFSPGVNDVPRQV
jgi:hypothetical protein